MQKILFVCTGNICRSPTAEGVFRHYVEQSGLAGAFHIDSAGTQSYHVGEPPDPRSVRTAQKRGIDISHQRSRRIHADDFHAFDHILALDNSHLRELRAFAPKGCRANIALFLEFAGATVETEVPDPYYGGQKGFDYVMELVEAAAIPLIRKCTGKL